MSPMYIARARDRRARRAAASFTVSSTVEACVITAIGELDLTVTGELAALLGREVGLRPPALVLDASAVTFCSARALTVLLDASVDAAVAEVPFAVVGRVRALLRPITVLGLEQLLPVHRSTDDALAWLALLPRLAGLGTG